MKTNELKGVKVQFSHPQNYAVIENGTVYIYSGKDLRFCLHDDELKAINKAVNNIPKNT